MNKAWQLLKPVCVNEPMLQIGQKGTIGGEIWRSMTQFKSFPTAFLMRHGSRAMSLDKGNFKGSISGFIICNDYSTRGIGLFN